ncbi:MAG: LolA family protein [Gaiellaceae bacterium]
MRFLRTLSTSRLVALIVAVVVVAAGVAAIAVRASGGSGSTPPPKSLADALHDSLAGPEPDGVTAKITFTNKLFPSGALTGQAGSALMSGASGRLWATNDGHGRLELQSDAGDVQVVWNQTQVSVFDASSNTVYRATLPAYSDTSTSSAQPAIPSVAEITDFLTQLADHVVLSDAIPSNVAGQEAYTVRVSPKHDGGLLGAAEVAFDSSRAVPLRIGIYAQGASSPVLELAATDMSYGPVSSGDVDISPPADAKTVDLGTLGQGTGTGSGSQPQVTGLAAVQAAAGFPVAAPDTLVGLPRQDVRLVGSTDSKAALVVYGHGLGAIVVLQRPADANAKNDVLGSLPQVSLDGTTAHELATQLGTALTWEKGGVSFVLAGSVPTAAAEAAARELG